MFERQTKHDSSQSPSAASESAAPAPGRHAVQRRLESASSYAEGQAIVAPSPHESAAQGVAGGGGQLPHLQRIQASFGRHDVAGVKAHTGGKAAEAADAIGASAYAYGNDVAFKGAPDLHTAAHEAAHVVQQRAGVQLYGGMGKAGDAYERHADAVADLVVRGQSAETLLDTMASGGGGGGAAVQRKGQGQILLSFDQVEAVWVAWVKNLSAARGKPENDASIMLAAGQRVKTQVGTVNHANWAKKGGGSTWIGPITYKALPPAKKKQREQEIDLSPTGTYNRLVARADKMQTAANKMNGAVVTVERQCSKLSSPEGAKGIAYQIAAGTMGLMYGVGTRGIHYAKEKGNPAGQAVNDAMGVGEKSPTIKEKAEELDGHANTSVELMTGKLNDLYKQTRPSYSAFQKALKAFDAARGRFNQKDYMDLTGLCNELDAMEAALKSMQAAAKSYVDTCKSLGIPAKALAVDKLDAAIVDGIGKGVELSVDMLGGLTADPKDALEKPLKEHAKDMLKEKTVDAVKDELPKAAVKRAAK